MTKRQIIDEIIVSNPTAPPEFLAQFDQTDLLKYLRHLEVVRTPCLTGDASRYSRYFPTASTRPADELSVLSPAPTATLLKCPAAVACPVDADLLDRSQFDADLLDVVAELDHSPPGDPRADTIEFEPIIVTDPARSSPAETPAEQGEPAEQTASADDGRRITYRPEPDLVTAHARNEGFQDEQGSWLF